VERYQRFRPLRDEAKQIRREAWTKVQEDHPDFSRSELIKEADTLYLWLRRYDSIWLESNLPEARPCTYAIPKKGKVDWESADSTLSLQIENAANRIKGLLPPVRVSKAEIIREVGHKNWLWFMRKGDNLYEQKLPRTLATLAEQTETLVEFQLRKLEWAAESYRQQKIRPTRSQLSCKATIKNNSGRSALVQKRLDAIFADLSKEKVIPNRVH
jgi:hypothetical protein